MLRYHWAFLIGPKDETQAVVPGVRYHAKNHPITGWILEEAELSNVRNTINLLARVLIAKIENEALLVKILRETPVVRDDPEWTCRSWIVDALSRIQAAGNKAVGTARLDWPTIEEFARRYVAEKKAAGRYAGDGDMTLPRPTWNLLEEREIVE